MPEVTIKEAVRIVGHLLEHHPTTGVSARNKEGEDVSSVDPEASCWCVVGAAAVTRKIVRTADDWYLTYMDVCSEITKVLGMADIHAVMGAWEDNGATDADRLAIARKLQKA